MKPTLSRRVCLVSALLASLASSPAADQYFAGDGSTLTASKWAPTCGGSYASAFTGGNVANFCVVNGTGAGAGGINVSGLNASENFTYSSPSGTLLTGGAVVPVTVAAGKLLDLNTLTISGATGVGFTKGGSGAFATAGGTYTAGFTLNDGAIIARGVNAMGAGGSLTVNGGAIGANANRDLSGKYTGGITVGGNFQLGVPSSAVSLASDTATLTFNNNVTLGSATRTITIGANGTYTLSGIVSGSSGVGLTVDKLAAATGTLSLNGANTFTGDITISAGTLTIGGSGSLTSGTYGGNIVNNGTLNLNSSVAHTLSGNISGSGSVLNGAGTTTLTGTGNTFTGDIGFTATGARTLSAASLGNGPGNIIILQNNVFTTTANITTTKGVSFAGSGPTLSAASGTTLTINGVVGGTSTSPNIAGPGKTVLNNANAFASSSILLINNSATLALGNAAALNGTFLKFNPAGSSLDNASGGALAPTGVAGLQMTTGFTFVGTDDLDLSGVEAGFVQTANSARTITVTAKTLRIAGIGGSGTFAATPNTAKVDGSLVKAGSGTLVVASASTYALGTTISAGTLLVNNSSGSGTGNGAVALNGGTLGGTGTIAGAVTQASGASIAPGTSVGTLTLSSDLTLNGGGALVMEVTNNIGNADKLIVGGSLNPSGTTTISLPNPAPLADGDYTLVEVTGTLGGSAANFSVPSAPGKIYTIAYNTGSSPKKILLNVATAPSGPAALTWWGGVSGNAWNTSAANWTNAFLGGVLTTFADGDSVNFDSLGAGNSTVDLTTTVSPGATVVNAATDYTFSGVGKISGTNSLSKGGVGNLTVATANDYTGLTTISNGLVTVSGSGTLGSSSAPLRVSGAALNLGATSQTVGAVTNISGTISNGTLTGASFVVESGTLSAVLAGVGATLTKSTSGSLALSGANSYSGGATLTAGTLAINSATALGSGTFTIAGGSIQNTSGVVISNANNNAMAWNGSFSFLSGTTALDLGTGPVTLGASVVLNNNGGNSFTNPLTVGGVIGDGGMGYGLTASDNNNVGITILAGLNTFSGQIACGRGILSVNTIKNAGVASSLGTGNANPTIRLGTANQSGTLQYTGGTTTTDRQIQVSSSDTGSGGAVIKNNGTGALVFTAASFNSPLATATSTKPLTFSGTSTDNNTVQGVIADNNTSGGGTVRLTKSETGKWILAGANTYSGGTTVSGGTLEISGSIKGNVTNTGGILRLSNASALESTAGLALSTAPAAGTVNLNFLGTQTINTLQVGTTWKAAGTWGAPGSTATHQDPAFEGSGVLSVSTRPGGGNNDPVAPAAKSQSTAKNTPSAFAKVKLLSGASDPDSGDTLSVSGVVSASAQGGTVVLEADDVKYTPAPDFTGSDTYYYVISDGNSGSALATVNVTVTSNNGSSPNAVGDATYDSGTGKFSVTFAGIPGLTYTIETATSPTGPWSPIGTATAGANGLFTVEDTQLPPPPARYYRTVYP